MDRLEIVLRATRVDHVRIQVCLSFHTHAGHDNQKATTRVAKKQVASLGENLSLQQPNRSIREIILILTIRLSLYHSTYIFHRGEGVTVR